MEVRRHHVDILPSAALGFAALFIVLAGWVTAGGSLPGERRLLVELNEALGTTLDEPMVAVGVATDSLVIGVVGVLVIAVLAYGGRRSDALLFLAIVGPALVLNPLLKQVVGRARPDVRLSPEVVSSLSFPSGHAAGTAALVGALVVVASTRRSRILTAVVGGVVLLIVAFSRLAIGVHYPSDIAGGWLWVASLVCTVYTVWSVRAGPDATPDRAPPAG